MADPGNNGARFIVHCSAHIAEALRKLQRKVRGLTRKKAIAAAFEQIVAQLREKADEIGEPFYRLPHLRLQVRTCIIRPLLVDFAVSEDQPLVFIKGVKLLPERGT